jgi:transketolase
MYINMVSKFNDALNKAAMDIPLDERSRYLRRMAVKTLESGKRAHLGSAMSIMEIIRVLYDDFLNYNANNPKDPFRDRFILSKGHGCLAQYVVLADKGFFDKKELLTFCQAGSILGGHPEYGKIPGVEASTGALGHGMPIAVGMALAAKLQKRNSRVSVIVGDGEINEGSIWEAAMSAYKHRLSNLTVFIDYNKIQSYGFVSEVLDPEPIIGKFVNFGFAVEEINGHDILELKKIVSNLPLDKERPTAVICHTIKGKGFPFAENNPTWHHKNKLSDAEIQQMYESI